MSAAIDRMKALVARAVHISTPEEEARSCAIIACRQIHQHGLLTGGSSVLEEQLRSLERRITELSRDLVQAHRDRDQARAELAVQRARGPGETKASGAAPAGDIVELASRYEGVCRVCHGPYRVGDRVAWRRGKGAVHPDCRSSWKAA